MPYRDPEARRARRATRYAEDPEYRAYCNQATRASRAANPTKDEMRRAATSRRRREIQDATTVAAIRRGAPWTPPEDRLVMDTTVPLVEIAFRLGRTYWSCILRRGKLGGRTWAQ